MCKHGDVFSLRVLIGRGLDLLLPRSSNYSFSLRLLQFSGFYLIQFAPLAQLVEQLTLNQRALGSSPWRCTNTARWSSGLRLRPLTPTTGVRIPLGSPLCGADYDEDPPVPIPNTEVKLVRAENTWRAASREDRSVPQQKKDDFNRPFLCPFQSNIMAEDACSFAFSPMWS